MDTRTDPGQYYPGGRVMVRPDVAPPQAKVNWSDIEGKPDFSDIPELEAADSDDNVKTAVNKIVDKMTTAIIVLLCGLCAVLSAPAATMLNYMSGTNEVYTAAETDAAIVRLAPVPGNYAAVSNAAMSAVQPAELVAATNDIPRVEAANPDMFPGWAQNAVYAGHADYSDDSSHATLADSARSLVDAAGIETRQSGTIFMQLDSIAGMASTNDVQLTPVYSQTPTFDKWTILRDGDDVTSQVEQPTYLGEQAGWSTVYARNDQPVDVSISYPEDAESMTWQGFVEPGSYATYTATRTRTDILGYVLGDQTNKVLASTNLQTGVSAAAVTNIVHDLSLGGIWDSQLEVWWTPRMRNGSLTYEATTNVNLNAGN